MKDIGRFESYVSSGVMGNPDPDFDSEGVAQATYDLLIRPCNESLMIKFGPVEWMISQAEAQWLADQLWVGAFLAAKLPSNS
ncbi:hypothetical protein NPS49_09615 [Pseudomonas putida]|uniref:hypothetical protein n=1 Tax=Pseudomonas putida TaxID=303 RepID=UPI0023637187|nr:hypothetical protein [Pseudomonas putida]MDD2068574.1 hypothetical protein [Pseudomonas putida]HDS1738510.1 hypothetical protein [Pseudomonas putida]